MDGVWMELTIGMFVVTLFAVSLISLWNLQKRPRFALRALVCLAVLILLNRGIDTLFPVTKEMLLQVIVTQVVKMALVLLAILVCFDISPWKAVFGLDIAYFVQHVSYCMVALTLDDTMEVSVAVQTAFSALMCVVLYFILFQYMTDRTLSRLNLVQIVSLTCIIILVCVGLNTYAGAVDQDGSAFYLMDLTCNVVGLLYQWSVFHNVVLERENAEVQRLLQMSRDQYQISKKNIELINIKCHDLKHQLQAFRANGLVDEQALQEMERVISQYDSSFHTGNNSLDVVLTEKGLLCTSKKIRFTCIASGESVTFMQPGDIYALFGNALDNAIEAADELDEESMKVIGLTVRKLGDGCVINLQNYTMRRLNFVNGLPVTTKSNKDDHGFGVRSMQLIAQKYGGELSYALENQIFNLDILLPGVS